MQDYIGVRVNSYCRMYVPSEHVQRFKLEGGRILRATRPEEKPVWRALAPLATVMKPRPSRADAWPDKTPPEVPAEALPLSKHPGKFGPAKGSR
jgi:hypothetical protein